MSYDIMVFDKALAPQSRETFMSWYDKETEWTEDHDHNDPSVLSASLRSWFLAIAEVHPPLNGPLAGPKDDDLHYADYTLTRHSIYTSFAWQEAETAYENVVKLAGIHQVGFFDVSSDEGLILVPAGGTELSELGAQGEMRRFVGKMSNTSNKDDERAIESQPWWKKIWR